MINKKDKIQICTDEVLDQIKGEWLLVSSKQLANFLGKKNDNSLRAARSNGTGFKTYKDPNGNIFYNLIQVTKQMGIKL